MPSPEGDRAEGQRVGPDPRLDPFLEKKAVRPRRILREVPRSVDDLEFPSAPAEAALRDETPLAGEKPLGGGQVPGLEDHGLGHPEPGAQDPVLDPFVLEPQSGGNGPREGALSVHPELELLEAAEPGERAEVAGEGRPVGLAGDVLDLPEDVRGPAVVDPAGEVVLVGPAGQPDVDLDQAGLEARPDQKIDAQVHTPSGVG